MKNPPSTTAREPASRAAAARSSTPSGSALAQRLEASPRLTAQRRSMDALFGSTAQRAGPEEELPAQGRFATAQLAGPEDELPMQGRFATAQRAGGIEEELPAQGRFDTAPAQLAEEAAAPNRTGMPDTLKAGIESLSGMDMSDVRVHHNSDRPAQLNALAYAQGNDIHLAAGQEKHLPHEAWHVVQQRQGRVAPTLQMQGVAVNDDAALEAEADRMGAQAAQAKA
jgi:hypothetical protein